ncbi:hypothetical protein H6S82_07730 [Planktothrix sp. FACHB-1355]|uniref:Uncharacterized protein n=1 Tax=Aerosakkonema funiforme FACHB-1375 TaxID=2949571 RepID=A0A926VJ45_9CYAN|nr:MULTISPECIES: hypothetical protein [Oscillatoriales]MBD2184665.1 hypothetical protein [Aerosakkonema funiforme FACHB-1375]MBD3558745.1 hypothetical protein [Planktothrix sp. FACHB-1355]
MPSFLANQSAIAHQAYDDLMTMLMQLYPKRLDEILHQHLEFSLAINLSECYLFVVFIVVSYLNQNSECFT